MNQTCHRQLQFPYGGVLIFNRHGVGLHQRIPVVRHVVVSYSIAVQRVEADPRSHIRVAVSEHCADIAVADAQLFHQLSRCAVPVTLLWHEFAVFLPAGCDITHVLGTLEQSGQIGCQVLHGVPLLRLEEFLPLQPVGVDELRHVIIAADLAVPVQSVPRAVIG